MARIAILFSWKPMPFYEHVYVHNLSYKLKFSRMAFASRPIMLVGLSATGSHWHLSFVVPKCGVNIVAQMWIHRAQRPFPRVGRGCVQNCSLPMFSGVPAGCVSQRPFPRVGRGFVQNCSLPPAIAKKIGQSDRKLSCNMVPQVCPKFCFCGK